MNKLNSYDEFWLSNDMQILGLILENSAVYARECYSFEGNFDRLNFACDFLNSELRKLMDLGHPKYLSQASIETFSSFVDVDCLGDLSKYCTDEIDTLFENQLDWAGRMYAFIHYQKDILTKELLKVIPLEQMLHMYITGHQMTFTTFYERIKDELPI